MVLEGLTNGSIVNLEVVTADNSKYEISSRVTGASKNALLIEPVQKGKQAGNIETTDPERIIYNIYADDPTGNRVGWYNVTVKPIDYKSHSYRGVWTRCFNQNSTPTDRRVNDRLKIYDMNCQVETGDEEPFEASLADISENGIAFFGRSGADTNLFHRRFVIHISDLIDGEIYNINIKCTCVRISERGGKTLLGCAINDADKAYLLFLHEKRLELRRPIACGQ